MNTNDTSARIDDQELTLVDIEELRAALGAEAQLNASAQTDAAAVPSTVMCPQWY